MSRALRHLEKFRSSLQDIWRISHRIDWSDPNFSAEKAYACAIFSKAAYLNIPEFELSNEDKVKIIPCIAHQHMVHERIAVNITEQLRSGDFANVFQSTNELAVAVGVVTSNVTIIALRGTRLLYLNDIATDVNALRVQVHPGIESVSFHKGFYLAISSVFESIRNHLLSKSLNAAAPIYVVGHSLGGAMAAILHGVGGQTFASRYQYEPVGIPIANSYSSLTFGMPRYGDDRAVNTLRNPHHCYNVLDIVPGVPGRRFGYADSLLEYELTRTHVAAQPRVGRFSLFGLFPRLNFARGIRHHFIERYISHLRSIVRP